MEGRGGSFNPGNERCAFFSVRRRKEQPGERGLGWRLGLDTGLGSVPSQSQTTHNAPGFNSSHVFLLKSCVLKIHSCYIDRSPLARCSRRVSVLFVVTLPVQRYLDTLLPVSYLMTSSQLPSMWSLSQPTPYLPLPINYLQVLYIWPSSYFLCCPIVCRPV